MSVKNANAPAGATEAAASTADREVVITRLINAPREVVFEAWSDPKHLDQWMGPTGFKTTTLSMDFRVGGRWRYLMSGPYGNFPSRAVYIEITKPERLVYQLGSDIDEAADAFLATVTFEKQGTRTLLTMKSVFPTAAARNHVVKEYKAIEGGNQTLDRLEQHVADLGR